MGAPRPSVPHSLGGNGWASFPSLRQSRRAPLLRAVSFLGVCVLVYFCLQGMSVSSRTILLGAVKLDCSAPKAGPHQSTWPSIVENRDLQGPQTSQASEVKKLLELQARIEGERASVATAEDMVQSSLARAAKLNPGVTKDKQNSVYRNLRGDVLYPECLGQKYPSQNGEDLFVFEKFFKTPTVKRDGVFFEMGGLDGMTYSNSLFYERCLGWQGVLIEGQPDNFFVLKKTRTSGGTRRLWMAGCAEDGGMLSFPAIGSAVSGDKSAMTDAFIRDFGKSHGNESVQVPCGPLVKYLNLAGIARIDFFSLDVEGAEMMILESMDWSNIEVHVLMLEMSGKRSAEIRPLLEKLGFVEDSKGFHWGSTLWYNASWVE